MMIYAILAVEYFSSFGMGTNCDDGASHCYQTTLQIGYPPDATFITDNVTSLSMRNLPYGFEYYGTFSRALYTLFQVLTGESWSEAVARPLIFGEDKDSQPAWFSAIFFTSFILLTQIVLVNVVVAVLLDQFVDDSDKPETKETVTLTLTSTLALTLTSRRPRRRYPKSKSNLARPIPTRRKTPQGGGHDPSRTARSSIIPFRTHPRPRPRPRPPHPHHPRPHPGLDRPAPRAAR